MGQPKQASGTSRLKTHYTASDAMTARVRSTVLLLIALAAGLVEAKKQAARALLERECPCYCPQNGEKPYGVGGQMCSQTGSQAECCPACDYTSQGCLLGETEGETEEPTSSTEEPTTEELNELNGSASSTVEEEDEMTDG